MGKNENSNPVGRGQDEDVEDQDEEQKTKVSLACTPRNGAVSNGSLVLRAEEEMCAWAFDILIAHLEGHPKRPPPPVSVVRLKECGVSCPAFVTWMKQRKGAVGFSREDADLRGCIGSLSPIPIMELGTTKGLSRRTCGRGNGALTPTNTFTHTHTHSHTYIYHLHAHLNRCC
ncbi:DUF51 family protein [Toxoplasma gondii MAS]|uniref:DUF51 family protein n=1 Tax=Toxoplasma gondii MAS TaxID=943118 RepID=A0A086PMY0_TOXGO|nr:DUF51 family protein [Toxoplasma gondii MAS]